MIPCAEKFLVKAAYDAVKTGANKLLGRYSQQVDSAQKKALAALKASDKDKFESVFTTDNYAEDKLFLSRWEIDGRVRALMLGNDIRSDNDLIGGIVELIAADKAKTNQSFNSKLAHSIISNYYNLLWEEFRTCTELYDYIKGIQLDRIEQDGQATKEIAIEIRDIIKGKRPAGVPWNVPYCHNDNFILRDNEFSRLHDLLCGDDMVAISQPSGIAGAGGVGKTQLAVEYCYAYQDSYPGGLLWVRAENAILDEYAALADELNLGLPAEAKTDVLCTAVRQALNRLDKPALLVLDNLDNRADYNRIRSYLPTHKNCRALITTRLSDLCDKGHSLRLDILTKDKAVEMLYKYSRITDDKAGADDICYLLGYLPIAIELAGEYLAKRNIGLSEYAGRLRASGVLDNRYLNRDDLIKHTDHLASVRATLAVNDTLLADERVKALLAALCCFYNEGINQALLAKVCGLDTEDFEDAVIELKKYHLIKEGSDRRISLHRLLHQALCGQLPPDKLKNTQVQYVTQLAQYSVICNDPTKLKQAAPELPHLIRAADMADKIKKWPQVWELGISLGNYYDNRGEYQEKLKRLIVLEKSLKDYPEDKPRQAVLLNNIGATYRPLGEYAKAVGYYERALAIDTAVYGDKRPSVARDLNNLGLAYDSLGEYAKAIGYYERALAIWKAVYGEELSNVATSLNNLGGAYASLGEYAKAIGYYERARAIDTAVYGDKHPNVAIRLNNLGLAYYSLGEYAKAIGYYERALAIDTAVYGDKHPMVAIRLNNLGLAYYSLGEYAKAIGYYERARAIDTAVYGDKHPSVAIDLNNLGSAYNSLGEYAKAIGYYEDALAIDTAVYGDKHPNVAIRLNNLGLAYYSLGEYAKAIGYYERAYDMFREFLPQGHPSLITVYNNLQSLK